jgi:hypothetical protein
MAPTPTPPLVDEHDRAQSDANHAGLPTWPTPTARFHVALFGGDAWFGEAWFASGVPVEVAPFWSPATDVGEPG